MAEHLFSECGADSGADGETSAAYGFGSPSAHRATEEPSIRRDVVVERAMGERRACVHTKNRVRAREDLRLQGQHLAWPPGAQAGCVAGLTSDIAARASDPKKRRGRRAITVRRCRALRSRPQHVA